VVAAQEITKDLELNAKALLYFAALLGEMQIKIKFNIRQMDSLHLKVSNNYLVQPVLRVYPIKIKEL
jgi:hypothetical protein